jgi:hypothetical protein
MIRLMAVAGFGLALWAAPAAAEVHDSGPNGFAVRATAVVPAGAQETWAELLDPADWWDGTHTFSGDAAQLSLDARAGGCFCELLPNAKDAQGKPRGGVQHLQVVYVEEPRVLRMTGALGPMQSEPVTGVLTFVLKPEDGGTRINAEYAIGGYLRMPIERIAPVVDRVIGEQVARLAAKLGAAPAAPVEDTAPPPSASPASSPGQPDAPAPVAPAKAPIIGR